MKKRRLGSLEVSAIGLGCVGMSSFYATADPVESAATIRAALDLGVSLIDTADIYGLGTNEELVGRCIAGRRAEVVISTKFGYVHNPDGTHAANGRPDYVPQACDASLRRLGVDCIDIFTLHRRDPDVPIEETVGAMGRLVEQGKIRGIGLSEVSVATLRGAHATVPITAVQSEYSLWTRQVEDGILPSCAELGIGFVPFTPLGRGFLTGTVGSVAEMEAHDKRRQIPRFHGEDFRENQKLLVVLRQLAAAEGCTPAQLALAWLLAQADFIVPIPGTTHRHWLRENAAAAALTPAKATLERLGVVFQPSAIRGARNAAATLRMVEE